jgi:two-component system sensor histidine kinase/response regulator
MFKLLAETPKDHKPSGKGVDGAQSVAARTQELFEAHRQSVFRRTDHLFAGLLLFEWVAGVAAACWISPRTWEGTQNGLHPHVLAAIFLGGAIISLPLILALVSPGKTITRHVIAVAQMLMSALLIHLTGGRIETHFHVFGSLAFLAFYRDWRVLISASVVVAADHFLRGIFWPQSVYGVLAASQWRWLEHAGWVLFEDCFLIQSCLLGVREMRATAERQAQVESTNEKLAATAEERSRLALVASKTASGVVIMGANGRMEWVNDAFTRMTGYSLAETEGRALSELLIGPNTDSESLAGIREHLDRAEAGRQEALIYAKDNSALWLSLEITPILDADGKVIQVIAITTDITKRKRAEAALRDSEERTRLIVETALDAVISMDARGAITGWNPQAQAIFGQSEREVLGRSASDTIIAPAYRQVLKQSLAQYLATGEAETLKRRIEVSGIRSDGSEFPAELSISPVQTEDAVAFTAFVRDITENKKAEAERNIYMKAVEEGRERAEQQAILLNAQAVELERARDQALESTRAKSQFLANMSHEIRTPMNGIIGMTRLLCTRTDLTKEQLNYANTIGSSAESLLTVLNDILDFSKIEAGKMSIESVDLDLRDILEEVAAMLAPRAHKKGLELACVVPPDFPSGLRGDPIRLRQVLINLTGNAIKFTSAGEVVMEVGVVRQTETDATLRLSVRDTGIGIPEERQEAIFASFTQADGSTTRRYGGTGLGLAICRQLVGLMQGKISVESEPGAGSTFWVELTLPKQSAPPPKTPNPAKSLQGLRALVVDDNVTNRFILREQLQSWGCQVVEAEDGRQALEVLRDSTTEDRFGVVLLDMHMPDLDGEETAKEIHANEQLADIPLILLSSGYMGSSSEMHARGFAAALTKPVRQSHLFETLLEALGDAERHQHLLQPESTPGRKGSGGPLQLPLRILLVEDNSVNQMVALEALHELGCKVVVAVNGLEALDRLAKEPFDLALMDVQMPEMDGFEATAEIRDQERQTRRHLPIIAMTAHAMEGDRERCLQAGMDDYISKPIDPDRLLDVLKTWAPTQASSETPAAPIERPRVEGEEGRLTPAFVVETLLKCCQGKQALALAVLTEFLRSAPQSLQTLQEAVAAMDTVRIHHAAHALKGSCRTLGAEAMADLCLEVELAGRDENAERATKAASSLDFEFGRLSAAIESYMRGAAWTS